MSPLFEKYHTIILDCDGVILDSNKLKNNAFETVLTRRQFNSTDIGRFMAYHQKNGGVSRYVKFEYFQREILGKPFDPELHRHLLEEFALECRSHYIVSSFTDGFVQVLDELKQHDKHVFIASGSDEAELRNVFKERQYDHHFTAIYGSPKPKEEIVKAILLQHSNCLFIGDSIVDLRIAVNLKIDFIALTGYSDNAIELEGHAINHGFPIFGKFSEIPR